MLLPLMLLGSVYAQRVDVDVSGVRAMYDVLVAMQRGTLRPDRASLLDSVLASRPYQTMFRHYNRSWRPNHLPPQVFQRMILSVAFPEQYRLGENTRADAMRPLWLDAYQHLPRFAAQIEQLEHTDLVGQVHQGMRRAREWLPPEWRIPDLYIVVVVSGGSPAFTIGEAEGYDFLQLKSDEMLSTIAHESHHMGIQGMEPTLPAARDSLAYEFLSLFVGEGTAVKFINNFPGGCIPAIDPARHDPVLTPQVAQWWRDYSARESEVFARFVATFDSLYAGTIGRAGFEKEKSDYWLSGYVSPIYFVGAELFGAAYTAKGKEGAFAAMRDPRLLLPLYQQTAKQTRGCPVLPDSTAAHGANIGQR